jgi:transcriptional regulator with XRE-family HTH domain
MRGYVQVDGEALREEREKRLLSVRQLAKLVGISPDTVNGLELGKRNAQPETVRKIASALRIKPERLILTRFGEED